MKTKHTNSEQELEKKVEEILRNRVIDIIDEYRGQKREDGFQVYLGYPQQLIDELKQLIQSEREKVLEEVKKEVIGEFEDGHSGISFGYYNESSTNKEQNARNELRGKQHKKLAVLAQKEEK